MKSYLIIIFFGLILLFGFNQCQKKEHFNREQVDLIIKEYYKHPIFKRVSMWDALLKSDTINEYAKAFFMFNKANDLQYLGRDKESIELYDTAFAIFKKYKDKKMIARTLINLGVNHAYLNHKKTAKKMILQGLELANEMNDLKLKSHAYGELAHIFYLNKDKKKSIEFLLKTAKMQEDLHDTAALSAVYNNIGIIYKKDGRIKEAYNFAKKSIYYKDSINRPENFIEKYNNLGELTFLYKKDKKQALKLYTKAIDIAKKNECSPVDVYENLIELYKATNQLDSAKYFLRKSLHEAPDDYIDRMRLYNNYLYFLLEQNNQNEAVSILKIKDSLNRLNQEKLDQQSEKIIENKLAIISQKEQLEYMHQLNNKNRIIFIFIIIIFVLGLFISYQLNRLDRLKSKQEKFILEQKVLRSQMNPHFIFNVLSSIQNSLIESKPIESATYLAKFAQLIRQNFDFIQKKSISIKEELHMLRNYLDTQKFRYKNKFDYTIDITPDINPEQFKIPPMVLQPFVENSIEHGFKNINYKGQLTVRIFKNNNKICFEIIDNGTGFNPQNNHKEHALDIFKKRLSFLGKEASKSFKITKLTQGTKMEFCLPSDDTETKKL